MCYLVIILLHLEMPTELGTEQFNWSLSRLSHERRAVRRHGLDSLGTESQTLRFFRVNFCFRNRFVLFYSLTDLGDMPVARHYDSDLVRVCRHAPPASQLSRNDLSVAIFSSSGCRVNT